jgi:hypothetical protein
VGFGENIDKAKEMAGEHSDQLGQGMDKAADFIDEKTGNKYSDQINQGREQVEQRLGQSDQSDQQPQ